MRFPSTRRLRASISPCCERSISRIISAFESVCSFDVLTPQISTFPCISATSIFCFWIYRQYFPAFPFDTENFRADSELFRGFCPCAVDDNPFRPVDVKSEGLLLGTEIGQEKFIKYGC